MLSQWKNDDLFKALRETMKRQDMLTQAAKIMREQMRDLRKR